MTLAIAAFVMIAKLSKNPFLVLASWVSLAVSMAFTVNSLMQAILKIAHPSG